MAAQNTTYELPRKVWVLLTPADITSATFQNKSEDDMEVMGTVDTTAPTDNDGAITVLPKAIATNMALSDLWPGQSYVRLWGWSDTGGKMMVSNA